MKSANLGKGGFGKNRPSLGRKYIRRSLYVLSGLATRCTVFCALFVAMSAVPRLLPGDMFDLVIRSNTNALIEAPQEASLRQGLGFADNLWENLIADAVAFAHADLGYSVSHGAPVVEVIRGALPWTALLILLSTPVFLLVGVTAGIEAGRMPGSTPDRLITGAMSFLTSIPPFVGATFLMLAFGILWPVMPSGGAEPVFPSSNPVQRLAEIALHAILPAIALSLHEVARYFYFLRGESVLLSRRAFILNARGRGIWGLRERRDYFGRNLQTAVFARLGNSIATLFSAVIYVETIFTYPGIGLIMYQAVLDRDYVLLRGAVAITAFLILALNWSFDLLTEILAERE